MTETAGRGGITMMTNGGAKTLLAAALFLALALTGNGCKQRPAGQDDGKAAAPRGAPGTGQSLLAGKDLIKDGFLTLRTSDVERVKQGVRELAELHRARVIEESLSVRDDSRRVYACTIRVPAGDFTVMMDRLSDLGGIAAMRVVARDAGDERGAGEDRIGLLKSRLEEARRRNDARLADQLRDRLAEAVKGRDNTARKILYSSIHLTVNESGRLSHAFALGFRYGQEGMIVMVKALLMTVIAVIPLLVVYVLLKFIRAFFRARWKKLLAAAERAGERPFFRKKTPE